MPSPRVCILRAPGTNCDHETAFAFDRSGGQSERLHLFRLLEQPGLLKDFQILCIPGGFSYGDDVGAGAVFGGQLRTRLADAIGEFLQRDTLTLGICNGFQVLMRAGVLPGGSETWGRGKEEAPPATLTWNASGRYTDLWVKLRTCTSANVFLRDIETLECPIAHAEGQFVVRESGYLQELAERGQIAFRYVDPHDDREQTQPLPFPSNPNGSMGNVAGLGDPTGRVLGLMPHPERFLFATQHPQWTRKNLKGEGAGFRVFRNAVGYFN